MNEYHSYGNIYTLGHRATKELFDGEVEVTTKIDGSQFSFRICNDEVFAYSKNSQLDMYHPDGMFKLGVEYVNSIKELLIDGYTYRGEYLQKPKHNVLAYNRVPRNNIMLWAIDKGNQDYMPYCDMEEEANRIGLEVVPLIYRGVIDNAEQLQSFLERECILGGQKIEGIVIKNYNRFGIDKKILVGKLVSAAFKESHKDEWNKQNKQPKANIIEEITGIYRTEARWQKAIQHLSESGKLDHSPKDIGLLIQETKEDVFKECKEEIMEMLFDYFWKDIQKGLVAGLAEFYKKKLMENM